MYIWYIYNRLLKRYELVIVDALSHDTSDEIFVCNESIWMVPMSESF